MKAILLASLVGAALLSHAPAGAQTNLDMEQLGAAGPAGWEQDHGTVGYRLSGVDVEPWEGERCLELSFAGWNKARDWGWAYQAFPAEPYHGQWVRFRAAMRVERTAAETGARLYVESYGPGRRSLSVDRMEERAVHGSDWQVYEVFAEVPPEAELIQIGATMLGPGELYLDGGSFEAVAPLGSPPAGALGPRNLGFHPGGLDGPWAWITELDGTVPAVVDEGPERRGFRTMFYVDQQPFGTVYQEFDATPYRGRLVRLRARAFFDLVFDDDAEARLWLRADRPKGRGFYDDLSDRPIGPGDRQDVEIVGRIDDDAETLSIGLLVAGGSVLWDDLSFEVIERGLEPPGPLEGRGLDNALAFTRLLGFVRHFHPSDGAAELDWDAFAVHGLRRVERCADAAELAAELRALFASVAPTVQVFEPGAEPPLPAALRAPADAGPLRVTAWRHTGYGQAGSRVYSSTRPRKRVRDGVLPDDLPDPALPFEADLPGGLRCRVPLALYVGREGTLPAGVDVELDELVVVEHRPVRLASVVLAWNVLQHFYPYFDVVETDWDAALVEALQAAALNEGGADLKRTLERMLGHLHDGHAWVTDPRGSWLLRLPLRWEWVEGRLLVTELHELSEAELPLPGDEVLSIDGVPAAAAIAREQAFVSASHPDALRDRTVQRLLAGPAGDEVTLLVESPAGERRELRLGYELMQPVADARPDVVAEIEPGLWYVDIDRLDEETLEASLDDLAAADGLVFDLRGYPAAPTMLPSFLTDRALRSPSWDKPRVQRPNRVGLSWSEGSWVLPDREPRLMAPTVFLADSRTQSAAETYLSFVEQYLLAEIVGEPTAGTNGNVNPFPVPGGFSISWTGMRVRKQDGSRHHGVGILPTIPRQRTRQGVIEGRDELLEAGLTAVRAAIAAGRGPGIEPRTAGAFFFAASRALGDDDLAATIAGCTAALALEPEHVDALVLRGRAHFLGRDSAPALADLDAALSLRPGDLDARMLRGAARYDEGQADEALVDLRAAVDGIEEPSFQALLLLAWVERAEGELDAARSRFDALLQREKRSGPALLGVGGLHYARGEWEDAADRFKQASRATGMRRSSAALFHWLAYERAGEPDKGQKALERELARWDEGDTAWFPAVAEHALGRRGPDDAVAATANELAWKERRARGQVSFWLGTCAQLAGDAAAARGHLEACIAVGDWDLLEHWIARLEVERLR
ncbi:MAG: S41 family peptidase [Planctomycetota bacterium]